MKVIPQYSEIPEAPPPEEKSNRTFLIMGGVMAGLVFLTLICVAIYFLVLRPRSAAQNTATQSAIETQNAQNIQKGTLTAQAALWTPTLLPPPYPHGPLHPFQQHRHPAPRRSSLRTARWQRPLRIPRRWLPCKRNRRYRRPLRPRPLRERVEPAVKHYPQPVSSTKSVSRACSSWQRHW